MIEYMNEDENHAAWCEERQGELNNEEKTNEDENSSAEVNDLQVTLLSYIRTNKMYKLEDFVHLPLNNVNYIM